MIPRRSFAFRLEPADEYMHDCGDEAKFNESMYFNFFDTRQRRGGFVRLGNRPHEKHAEMTVCLYEPDGSVLFQFARPEISNNERFDAGGARFEVVAPFERLAVAYEGSACRLERPLEMSDPKAAFTSNPFVEVRIDLSITGIGPMFGGERMGAGAGSHELEFAKGHYEQHHRATGTLEIAGRCFDFDGLGLRDHSWGPRSWQAPAWYRWLTANFGEDLGFMASIVASRDGVESRGGFVHRGKSLMLVRDVAIETEYASSQRVHDRIRAVLTCGDNSRLEVEGRVLSLIPLRNRRGGHTTRISEGMTEWTLDGRTGYGLSEYLDQID